MSLKSLEDVLVHAMKDLLSAERQFRDGLKKLAKEAEDEELAAAFEGHREETVKQIERLEQAFEALGRSARSEKCKAAAGLTDEAEDVMEEEGESSAKDVMLAAAGRKTEHYEIASYTDAISWAKTLDHQDVADLLEQTLNEEKAAAEKLERIAQRVASAAATG